MLEANVAHAAHTQVRQTDKLEYRLLMALTVPWFLVVSVATRWLPSSLRPFASSGHEGESCWEEARRMAQAIIPYAFEW
ncbi:MAG: hypothetical protein AB8B57_14075 [Congregibacter sp.]